MTSGGTRSRSALWLPTAGVDMPVDNDMKFPAKPLQPVFPTPAQNSSRNVVNGFFARASYARVPVRRAASKNQEISQIPLKRINQVNTRVLGHQQFR